MKNKPQKQDEKHKGRKQLLAATGYNQQNTTSKTKPKELERFQADMRRKEKKRSKQGRAGNQTRERKACSRTKRKQRKKGNIYKT